LPDFENDAGNEYVCSLTPVGALKFRDGPVGVPKPTLQSGSSWRLRGFAHVAVAAVVGRYQLRPWSTKSGAARKRSVS
jgi:hypothetical protein